MLKNKIPLYISILLFLFEYTTVSAGGPAFTNQYTQVAQAESRAVIIFDGKKEILLDSLTFNINPISQDNFVWVIPVPSKPEVEPIKDELYVKFEKLTEKKIDKTNVLQKLLYFDVTEEKTIPSSIFTRPVDIWKFDIVEPGDYEKLNQAVREMGYFIPKGGRPLVREYVEKNWYFVVAHVSALHIQMQASESLTVTGAHTLPLKIVFNTDEPIYPLKLASIGPDPDSEYAGLSYDYGTSSETILGDKDERVDEVLSEPSKNKFPLLPLDYVNLKTDLFVLSDNKVSADGFTTIYANRISGKDINFNDFNDKKYVEIPSSNWYLTRMVMYKPISQLEDVKIINTADSKKVNANPGMFIQIGKLLILLLVSASIFVIGKKRLLHKRI